MERRQLWQFLERLSTLAVLVVAGVVVWHQFGPRPSTASPQPTLPKERIPLQGAASIGSPSAKVAFVMFSDFQCPYCSRFARESWPKLRESYVDTGRILTVFRHLPLERLHPLALRAAQAAECGAAQDRFWNLHDYLFDVLDPAGAHPLQELSGDAFLAGVGQSGVDTQKFASCFTQRTIPRIDEDVRLAAKLGIASTPVFVVGAIFPDRSVKVLRIIRGAQPIAEFRSAIDAILASGGS